MPEQSIHGRELGGVECRLRMSGIINVRREASTRSGGWIGREGALRPGRAIDPFLRGRGRMQCNRTCVVDDVSSWPSPQCSMTEVSTQGVEQLHGRGVTPKVG